MQSWYWEFIEMVLTLSTPSQPCLPPLLVFFLLLTGSMHAGAKADLDLLSRSPVSRLDGTPGWLSPHHLPVPTRPNAAQAVSQSGTKCFPTALTCLGKKRALCVCTCSKHTPTPSDAQKTIAASARGERPRNRAPCAETHSLQPPLRPAATP